MEKPRIPLSKPIFDDEMKDAAICALQNERFVLGESVYKFEEEFARYCGTEYAVSTSSGTDALHLSQVHALGENLHRQPVCPEGHLHVHKVSGYGYGGTPRLGAHVGDRNRV